MANYEIDSFKNIQELIRFTDQKAGVVLVSNGLILSIFFRVFTNDFHNTAALLSDLDVSCLLYLTRFLYLLCAVVYLFFAIIVIFFGLNEVIRPRLAPDGTDFKGELFYFQSIASKDVETFKKEYMEAGEGVIREHIVEQTHIVADLLTKKNKALAKTFRLFAWSIGLFIFLCFLNLFIGNLS